MTATLENLQMAIESSRDCPCAFGDVYYWDPYGGNDVNTGLSKAQAVATFSQAQTLVTDGNYDVIYAIGTDPSGITIADEVLILTKNNFSLRGPGMKFLVKPSTPGSDTVTITGDNISIESFEVSTAVGGSDDGVVLNSTNSSKLVNIWLNGVTNSSIVSVGSAFCTIEGGYIIFSGNHGIDIQANTNHIWIRGPIIHATGGDGIHVEGASIVEPKIISKTDIHLCDGYGVNLVTDSIYAPLIGAEAVFYTNTLGNINDPNKLLVWEGNEHSYHFIQENWGVSENFIHINTDTGTPGTLWPQGTSAHPVDTITDAKTISEDSGTLSYAVTGEITLDKNYSDWNFRGESEDSVIHANGQTTNNTHFVNITLSGTMSGHKVHGSGCKLDNTGVVDGTFERCGLFGIVTTIGQPNFFECYSLVPGTDTPVLDFAGNSNVYTSIRAYSGGINLKNVNNGSITVDLLSGHAKIDSTCTGGTIVVRGAGHITDNSTGATVVKIGLVSPENVSDYIWDEILTGATHNIPSSAARRLRGLGDAIDGEVNDASATITSFITDLVGGFEDHYIDQTLFFTSGNLAGISRIILTFDNATKTVTIDEDLPEAPSNGDEFSISPVHVHTISQIVSGTLNAIIADYTVAGSVGQFIQSKLLTVSKFLGLK